MSSAESLVPETVLEHHTPGSGVAREATTMDAPQPEVCERIPQDRLQRLGAIAIAPMRLFEPIPDLRLVPGLNVKQTDRSDQFAGLG